MSEIRSCSDRGALELQNILNKRGYIVVGCETPWPLGAVVEWMEGITVAIIEDTDEDDAKKQKELTGIGSGAWPYYFRVVAE